MSQGGFIAISLSASTYKNCELCDFLSKFPFIPLSYKNALTNLTRSVRFDFVCFVFNNRCRGFFYVYDKFGVITNKEFKDFMKIAVKGSFGNVMF